MMSTSKYIAWLYLGIEFYWQRIHVYITKSASRITKFYTWTLCHSYLHEKQTSRIQSLYLYFIKIVPFFGYEISVFNTKHPVIILRGSLFVVTPAHVASWKNGCQNVSYIYRSRKH